MKLSPVISKFVMNERNLGPDVEPRSLANKSKKDRIIISQARAKIDYIKISLQDQICLHLCRLHQAQMNYWFKLCPNSTLPEDHL